jgi:branched-chain amino acid transport system permease protein
VGHVPNPRPAGDFRTSYVDDNALFKTKFEGKTALGIVLALIIAAPFLSNYVLSQLIVISIYAIAALGLNILVGVTGQISLGHGAFFGFGAFSSAWIVSSFGIPAMFAIPLAGVMTTAIGMIFGVPAARIKGLYLAIATLASQFILEDFFARADWFSGGVYGALAARPSIFGLTLDTDLKYFYLVLFWLVVSVVGITNLLRSRDGRALVAVRDHYLSAEIMGVNLTKYRILSFGISSFFAGLAGALFAHYLEFVSVEGFTILLSIQFLAMIIIGGLGSVYGTILGVIFVLLLPQVMDSVTTTAANLFPAIASGKAYMKEMSVGAAIILFLIFEPEGLIHRWRVIRASWKLFPFAR